jgi:hypothetical protein
LNDARFSKPPPSTSLQEAARRETVSRHIFISGHRLLSKVTWSLASPSGVQQNTPYDTLCVPEGNRTVPLLIPSIGTEWWWVTKDTTRLHYPQQESRYPTGWAPRPVWTGSGEDKIFPHRDSNPEPSSPYRFATSTTLLQSLLLQTHNRKNPSHFDPAIEWASQSAPHVKFVFLDIYIGFNYRWKKFSTACRNLNFSYTVTGTSPSSPSTIASQKNATSLSSSTVK